MNAELGAEARYMGQRVKILDVRRVAGGHVADILYMTGSYAGMQVTVNEDNLEPLGATARPTFARPAGARA